MSLPGGGPADHEAPGRSRPARRCAARERDAVRDEIDGAARRRRARVQRERHGRPGRSAQAPRSRHADGRAPSNGYDPLACTRRGSTISASPSRISTRRSTRIERLFGAEVSIATRLTEQGVEAASVRVGDEPRRAARVARRGDAGRASSSPGAGRACITSPTRSSDLRRELRGLAERGRRADRRGAAPQGLFGLEVAFVHPDSVHGVLAELVASG